MGPQSNSLKNSSGDGFFLGIALILTELAKDEKLRRGFDNKYDPAEDSLNQK